MNTDYFVTRFGLAGRRALVTGAGRGIGQAIATALAAAGAEVALHYHRSADAAEQVARDIEKAGGTAWTCQADLTAPDEVRGLFASLENKWPALDLLVNNAGDLVARRAIADLSDDLIDTVVRVNLHTAVYTTRQAIPLLRRGTRPSIINVSSIAAHNGGANGATLYAATKGALLSFTRGLAKELAPAVRVNALAPGVIMTDFHRRHSTAQSLQALAGNTPLQRLGEAVDLDAAAVFLAGDGASFVTGEMIEVNGGLWLA